MKNVITLLWVMIWLGGCGDSGAIYFKDPFFKVNASMPESRSEAFIEKSRRFAELHDLEININRFGNGKFSTLVYNDRISIGALNTTAIGKITIDSKSRSDPTEPDRILVRAYMAAVRSLLED